MYQAEVAVVTELVRRAGAMALEIHDRHYQIEHKADDAGPVTEADHALNQLLVSGLREAFPGDLVIGEESDHTGRTDARRTWFIDPIDGTKDFIKKNGEWSVMVGLALEGVATFGMVYQPDVDRLYWGAPGIGALRSVGGGPAEPIRVNSARPLQRAIIVNSRSHPDARIDAIAERLGTRETYRHGSVGCKLAHISEGRADLYFNLSGRSCKWDTCAPEAILAHAGGRVVTFAGEPLPYGDGQSYVSQMYVAGPADMIPRVLEVLGQMDLEESAR